MRTRPLPWLATLSIALTSLAGCGAEGSEKAIKKGDSGTTPPGDGGVVPSTRPSPGTPPKSAIGIVGLVSKQGNDGAVKVTANGIFTSPPTDLSVGDPKAFLNGYPTVSIDACAQLAKISTGGGSSSTLDFGALTLATPTQGTLKLTKQAFAGMTIYSATLASAAFAEDGTYTLSAAGGAGGAAFSGKFYAPRALTLTKPALTSAAAVTVPRSAPLELAWTARPDGDPVIVRMVQGDTTVICKATDDGSFQVPASALASFGTTTAPASGEDPDSISVTKSTWYAIDANGSAVLANAESGATFEVSFQ